jgi:hypothetical protein
VGFGRVAAFENVIQVLAGAFLELRGRGGAAVGDTSARSGSHSTGKLFLETSNEIASEFLHREVGSAERLKGEG